MQRSRVVQLCAVLVCLGLIGAAATRVAPINKGREQLNVLGHKSPVANAPPEYAFWVQALGAFRGLIVDIAFIRAESFKEQGRYYDAMSLAEWICTLQPHFPSVWEFAAWNMAWNISVTTYTPEERWNWVYNGVRLLRDSGIPLNPRAFNLYKQLAWTYNNKMGEITDEFHYNYKCNWAWRMHLLLGLPPRPQPDFDPNTLADVAGDENTTFLEELGKSIFEENQEKRRKEAEARGLKFEGPSLDTLEQNMESEQNMPGYNLARQTAYDFVKRIADAPADLDDLFRQYPEARAMVAALGDLGVHMSDKELTEDDYWRDEGLAFTFFAPYREATAPATVLQQVLKEEDASDMEQGWQTQGEKILAILKHAENHPAGAALVAFLQRKVLHDVYKMDASFMATVVEEFGPVDWRSVDATALYWVSKSIVEAGETITNFRNDRTNTLRIMFFCLRNLFLRNQMVFEPNPERINLSYLNLSRDLNFIESMHQAFIRWGALFDPRAPEVGGTGDTYRVGHQNFLTEAIRLLYLSGRKEAADRYYAYLQQTYPRNEAGQLNPAYQKTLRDFVMDDFYDRMGTPGVREIRLTLEGFFEDGFNQLVEGDLGRFDEIMTRSKELWDKYHEDKGDRVSERLRLPPMGDLITDFLRAKLTEPLISPLQMIDKVRLWRALPLRLRQPVYDDVLPYLTPECDMLGFDLARAFPEPANMETYRATRPDRSKEEREGAVKSLVKPSSE